MRTWPATLVLTLLLTSASAQVEFAEPNWPAAVESQAVLRAAAIARNARSTGLGDAAYVYAMRSTLRWTITREDHWSRLDEVRAEYARIGRRFQASERLFRLAFEGATPVSALRLGRQLAETRLHAHALFELDPGPMCKNANHRPYFLKSPLYYEFEWRAVAAFEWVVQRSQSTLWTADSEAAWNHLAALRPRRYRRFDELRSGLTISLGLQRVEFLTNPN